MVNEMVDCEMWDDDHLSFSLGEVWREKQPNWWERQIEIYVSHIYHLILYHLIICLTIYHLFSWSVSQSTISFICLINYYLIISSLSKKTWWEKRDTPAHDLISGRNDMVVVVDGETDNSSSSSSCNEMDFEMRSLVDEII